MIKKICYLVLILSTMSCQTKSDKKYADDFNTCLTVNDIEILNRATSFFEEQLADHYGSQDNEANFNTYLQELGAIQSRLNVPLTFYLNDKSIEIIKEFEKRGTFSKIWTKFIEDESEAEIPIVAAPGYYEQEEKDKLEIYILNPNGQYLKCINELSVNEGIKDVLNSQSKYGDIASTIVAGALKQKMNENDFDKGLNEVIVAIGFYYNTVNLLYKNPR